MQRVTDVFLAGLAIVVLTPLLLPLAIMLRFTGEGEVLYRQSRIGIDGQIFKIYKFATMLKNSSNIGSGTLTMKNDPRVLPIGVFLKKTKINELPQLLNILFGDMSIVGPRPLLPDGEELYSPTDQKVIRSVRPGVTGIGSLMLRDEESYYAHRSDAHEFYMRVISPYKAELEVWYIKRKSFWLDIKLIILTFVAIITPTIDLDGYFNGLPEKPSEL